MPPDSPDRASSREELAPAPAARQPPRWHYVLYGLALLSLLALSSVLYLEIRIIGIYSRSVAETRVWESRQEAYSILAQFATDLMKSDLGVPAGDDPLVEAERMAAAATAFRGAIDRAVDDATGNAVGELHEALVEELHEIRTSAEMVHEEIQSLVSLYAQGKLDEAYERSRLLRTEQVRLYARIEGLDRSARDVQSSNLSEQESVVLSLLNIGIVVAVVVAMIVVWVCFYGRRMWHQASLAARDLERSEAVLRDSARRMRRILDSAHDAFVGMDERGRIVEWNARAEAVFGWKRDEAIGRDLVETILPAGDRDASRIDFELSLHEGPSKFVGRCIEIVALHRSGVLFPVEMAATAVRSDDGVVLSAFLRDITERKRGEEALKKSEERFELAVRGSSDGLWDWNVAWDEFYLSPRCKELLRADDLDEIKTHKAWLARVHAGDRPGLEATLRAHFEERAPFDVECRLRTGSGDHTWFQIRGQAIWSEEGEPVRMAGSITDITQHKNAIESLMRFQGIAEAKAQIEAQAAQLALKTTELEQARTLAESANRSKSEFLANMSHEIRTPMTAILGYSDLLANPSLSSEDRRDGVQRIRQNGRHLLAILNDILDLSKIEAGKMTVERIECSVHEIVTEIAALMMGRAMEKGLDLVVEYTGRIPATVRSDPTRLRQILMNLIGNAIKFTEQGGVRLVVGLSLPDPDTQARIGFEVIDTGIGMSADQVSAIFRPFTQGDPSMARRFGGTGLGLTISRRLAEMLGGSISVKSRPGLGTTFRVEIETGPIDAVEMIRPVQGADLLEKEETPPGHDVRVSAGGECLLRGLRVLLADDARDNRKIVSWHLRRAGAIVDLAENGQIAMDKALEASATGRGYDAVLMDMQMPELDGFSATRALREKGFARPIIALTAHAMTGDREQCLAAGCDDYATKPIDPPELVLMLARWVASHPAVEDVAAALPAKPEEPAADEASEAKPRGRRKRG